MISSAFKWEPLGLGPGYPSSPHSLPGRDHSHHPLAWGAPSRPRPPRPGLPNSPPGPAYWPPALGSHGCPAPHPWPILPRPPHMCVPNHPSVPGAQTRSPGHTWVTAGSLTLCPQVHIVPHGFWQCPPGAHGGVCWGQWAQKAAGCLPRLHSMPGPHLAPALCPPVRTMTPPGSPVHHLTQLLFHLPLSSSLAHKAPAMLPPVT